MKIWIDDLREAPEGYVWIKSTNRAKQFIYGCKWNEAECGPISFQNQIEIISLDHDAGDYAHDGGDYIRILDYIEEMGWEFPIHIHSQNPVGVENMRRIIQRNNWKEVF